MAAEPMVRLDWDDLKLFVEIAHTGTLIEAAERLRLSQPTAGRRLRRLEEAVGAALFQRTPAGFRLTNEGEAMLVLSRSRFRCATSSHLRLRAVGGMLHP